MLSPIKPFYYEGSKLHKKQWDYAVGWAIAKLFAREIFPAIIKFA